MRSDSQGTESVSPLTPEELRGGWQDLRLLYEGVPPCGKMWTALKAVPDIKAVVFNQRVFCS